MESDNGNDSSNDEGNYKVHHEYNTHPVTHIDGDQIDSDDGHTNSSHFQYPVSRRPKSKKKMIIIIVVAAVAVILISLLVWYFAIYKGGQQSSVKKPSTSTSKGKINPVTESDPQLAKFISPTTGEVWLDKPVSIGKQGYIETNGYGSGDETETTYFQVGTSGKNTIILTVTAEMGTYTRLFEKYPDGTVKYIAHPNSIAVYNTDYDNSATSILAKSVLVDQNTRYDSLSIPDQIKFDDKGSVVLSPTYPTIGYPYSTPLPSNKETLVKQLGGSALYKNESTNSDTKLVSISYFIKTPINTRIALRYEPLDLSLNDYQWQSGWSTNDSIHAISRGCGSSSAAVTRDDSIQESDVQQVGKSANHLTVYGFKSTGHPLVKKAYDEFKQFIQYDTNNAYKDMTIDEFLNQHALVVYKDVNGQWLVYVRDQLSFVGGCAKPVVYLYPTTEQKVTVKVGADVKISDPYYNANTGWTAYAKPSGQLTVNGSTYNSLFWEGPGIGKYPEITEGIVVKQKDLVKTIRKQLAEQGLNTTEANDFMNYWQDKLPTKPYVRLTWFNTAQMNELAPLYISPKPTTTIRVFLDASGLDKPISIPAQTLKSIPRSGFTVVEWGGLPSSKLY